MLLRIALGLLGLGIVVFIHELGHFLAARFVGIDVEAFSIGWGNPVVKKKIGKVEYRLGMFPLGGYCKMKAASDHGVDEYKEAYELFKEGKKPEEGSYLAASPLKRILVCFCGPFFNFLFAVLLLSFLWGAGVERTTLGNRIVMASELTEGEVYPADLAGLQTGDLITGINGQEVNYYHEILEIVSLNPNRQLILNVERDGQRIEKEVVPYLDRASGAGRIGVSFWTDPVIESVREGSLAAKAGLQEGDIIISANEIPVKNTFDIRNIVEQRPERLILEYRRGGTISTAVFENEAMQEIYSGGDFGFSWALINFRTERLSPAGAVLKGIRESVRIVEVSVRSLRLLFMGIDLTQAVSGPVRITYMMGDMATQSFAQGAGTGFRSMAEFLALISIALCIMNLLPLPIIDGGMIILFFVEFIRKKPPHPKTISVFQTCGMVIIFSLLIFAVFGDILFFIRQ